MMRARYFDPDDERTVEVSLSSTSSIDHLVQSILGKRSGRGHPALEFYRGDGSSLCLATDGRHAYVNWTNTLGESFQSVGGEAQSTLVFDYFGSWSEAYPHSLVPLEDAEQSAKAYIEIGAPDTDRVLFEPD
jgi:hypothetical protein